MRRISIILFALLIVIAVRADELLKTIDSLYSQLDKQEGHQRIETLISLSEAYRLVSFDKSLRTGEDAVNYANENGFQKLKGKVLKSLGISAYQSGDYALAISYYQKALEAYDQVNDLSGKAAVINNLGLVHKLLGENDKALTFYNQAFTIQEQLGDERAYATTNINIASIYYQLGELDKAYDAYYKSQLIFKKLGDSLRYATVTNNIANVYWQWDQNDKALELLDETLEIYQQHHSLLDMSRVIYTKGLIYAYDKGDHEIALEMFRHSLDLREKIGNPQGTGNVVINIANIWMDQQRYTEAFEFYERGLRIHRSIGYVDGILMAYYYMGVAHQKMGNYLESNRYFAKCQEKAAEFEITQYEELIIEGRMKNFAALGDFENFSIQFDHFIDARDTLISKYLDLQTEEAHKSFRIEELMTEIALLSANNTKIKSQLQIYQFGLSSLLILAFLLVLFWLSRKKIKQYRRRKKP
ncbi:MAG: tetratricopeptide repeat protein [Bacteroidetes bacterium]|nr:tetratricopeptide repeat protein [Bacteroidota bacterium]